jgi:hypothetical protein
MSREFVIDVELFKKYCSETKCSYIIDVAISKLNGGEDKYVIWECHCVRQLLEAIRGGKCVLAYNKKILLEYKACLDKMPDEVVLLLGDIMSNSKQIKKFDMVGLELEEIQKIEPTELRHKKIYLCAAKHLEEKIIVCSKDELVRIYRPNLSLLFDHCISANCVCDQWDKVKNCVK